MSCISQYLPWAADASAASAASALPLPALGQGKPDKLVYVGDNGPWHYAMVEEVAPAFEKATGTSFQHIPYRGNGPALQDLVAAMPLVGQFTV